LASYLHQRGNKEKHAGIAGGWVKMIGVANRSWSVRRLLVSVLGVVALVGWEEAGPLRADIITFASATQKVSSANDFQYTNNGTSTDFNSG
jgi:hypothetical protein